MRSPHKLPTKTAVSLSLLLKDIFPALSFQSKYLIVDEGEKKNYIVKHLNTKRVDYFYSRKTSFVELLTVHVHIHILYKQSKTLTGCQGQRKQVCIIMYVT